MQPLRNPQLKPIPAALGLKPRFWSSFTFMCKWAYFEAMKKSGDRIAFKRDMTLDAWVRIHEPQPVRFVGPHPRLRQQIGRMVLAAGTLSGVRSLEVSFEASNV